MCEHVREMRLFFSGKKSFSLYFVQQRQQQQQQQKIVNFYVRIFFMFFCCDVFKCFYLTQRQTFYSLHISEKSYKSVVSLNLVGKWHVYEMREKRYNHKQKIIGLSILW